MTAAQDHAEIKKALLLARDARQAKRLALGEAYGLPVITVMLNIPGPVKDTPLYRRIHAEAMASLEQAAGGTTTTPYIHRETSYPPTGPEGYLVLAAEGPAIKDLCMSLEENHALGRIFDLDVWLLGRKPLSRQEQGKTARQCLICPAPAAQCMRECRHSQAELVKKIQSLAIAYWGAK